MTARLDAWQLRGAASAPLRFLDVNLRGAGQVMFQDHPLAGALFIAAIAWGLGIPALTAPFVLCACMFLLPQQHLQGSDDGKR